MHRSTSSRRRYIDANGRLSVVQTPQRRYISIPRLLGICSLVFALILTNPANPPPPRFLEQWISKWIPHSWSSSSLWKNLRHSRRRYDRTNIKDMITNYGFFALRDHKVSQTITFSALGIELSCSYRERNDFSYYQYYNDHPPKFQNPVSRFLCRTIFHEHAVHGKPLWYDPSDRSYTVHRTFLWIFVATFLWSCCYTIRVVEEEDPASFGIVPGTNYQHLRDHRHSPQNQTKAKPPLLLLLLRHALGIPSLPGTNPMTTFFHQCFSLFCFLDPAFSALDILGSLQDPNSRWVASIVGLWSNENQYDWQYFVSIFGFIIMASLINHVISWVASSGGRHAYWIVLDPVDALSVCSIGYVTFCQDTIRTWWYPTTKIMTTTNHEFGWWWSAILQPPHTHGDGGIISGQAVFWTFLGILTLRRRRRQTLLAAWIVAIVVYWAGRLLAQYHYENIVFVAWIRQGWNWLEHQWMQWEYKFQQLLR